MQLVILPLRILHKSSDRNSYMEALLHFALYILPIPRLITRLTKPVSEKFAVDIGLFLEDLESLIPFFPRIESQTTLQSSIYSLSNLMLFTPPRYSRLSTLSYDAYLRLLTILLNHVPEDILPVSKGTERKDSWTDFCTNKLANDLPTELDIKTRSRVGSILSSDHVCKLLNAADCSSKLLCLVQYLPQLCFNWPSQARNVLNAVATTDAARFARLLYVEKVSGMPLGKSSGMNPINLIGGFVVVSFNLGGGIHLFHRRLCKLRTLGATVVLH
jgi:hypothetical protein